MPQNGKSLRLHREGRCLRGLPKQVLWRATSVYSPVLMGLRLMFYFEAFSEKKKGTRILEMKLENPVNMVLSINFDI